MKAEVRAMMEKGWTCPPGVHKDCFVVPPPAPATLPVPRETLERIEAAMATLLHDRGEGCERFSYEGPEYERKTCGNTGSEPCPACAAVAALASVREVLKGEGMACPCCRGLGTIQAPVGGYGSPAVRETCPTCGGTGWLAAPAGAEEEA